MGMSTNGLLWFGYCADDDEAWCPEADDESAAAAKLSAVDDEWRDDVEGTANQLLKPFGCEMVAHCSSEYPMYGIAITGTATTAWRGHPKPVTPTETPDPSWADQLRKAAEAIGWPLTEDPKPQWWLASMLS